MSMLSTVITGKKRLPMALLIYGVHGIGKTTAATSFPNPIFVGSEENDEIEAARFPRIENWKMLSDQLKALKNENHEFKTVIIDSIDMLQQVAEGEILMEAPGKTMATAFGGYGKAYERMYNMFIDLRDNYLKPLRSNGMNVILLCHADKSKHEDPMTASSWDNYKPSLHKKVAPIFQDWVSAILFANYKTYSTENDDGKVYAEGLGERVIYSEERPSHVAKNRFKLPYELKLKEGEFYDSISSHVKKFYDSAKKSNIDADKKAYAVQLSEKVDDQIRSKVLKTIEECENDLHMNQIIERIENLTKD